ncbi:hypothetical protein XELAEV_18015802mg [Xenopus laevis]|uniref:Uncharacterized protein n=1 Tax=Xenopus laevis TaxID=8355 RepID=A0A974DJV5_XENLA|nr:hypothetical protein XELAEV_18015802mg [Xenopus laevis]
MRGNLCEKHRRSIRFPRASLLSWAMGCPQREKRSFPTGIRQIRRGLGEGEKDQCDPGIPACLPPHRAGGCVWSL